MKKISKATVLVLSLIMIVGSTRVNSYAAETTNDILPKQILDRRCEIFSVNLDLL